MVVGIFVIPSHCFNLQCSKLKRTDNEATTPQPHHHHHPISLPKGSPSSLAPLSMQNTLEREERCFCIENGGKQLLTMYLCLASSPLYSRCIKNVRVWSEKRRPRKGKHYVKYIDQQFVDLPFIPLARDLGHHPVVPPTENIAAAIFENWKNFHFSIYQPNEMLLHTFYALYEAETISRNAIHTHATHLQTIYYAL